MNTAKIAALYASPIFNTLLRYPAYDPSTSVTKELQQEAMLEQSPNYRNGKYHAATSGELSTTYRVGVQDFKKEKRYDVFGCRMYALVEGAYPERVYRWATQQLPAEDNTTAQGQRWVASANSYTRDADREIVDSSHLDRFGSEADFATLVRGLRAYRRKLEKSLKKQEAQLRAYHQQQLAKEELANLRRGHWLGAEKALTTAARVDEPGIPYMGDANLSDEQFQQHCFWTVPEDAGMGAAFPAGTGLAMRQVKPSQRLVDGAVYLYQWRYGTEPNQVFLNLGRLDKSAKESGYLPLRSDATGEMHTGCLISWTRPGIKIFRVTHYTTRSAAPVPVLQVETQPSRVQPRKRQPRRELAYAA